MDKFMKLLFANNMRQTLRSLMNCVRDFYNIYSQNARSVSSEPLLMEKVSLTI